MDKEQLGKNIKYFRQKQQLTQEGLAEKIDISSSYMTMIENGTRNVSLDVLMRIANELEVPIDWLISTDYSPSLKKISALTTLYSNLKEHSPEDFNWLHTVVEALSKLCLNEDDD